jgi:hypothetical protein
MNYDRGEVGAFELHGVGVVDIPIAQNFRLARISSTTISFSKYLPPVLVCDERLLWSKS